MDSFTVFCLVMAFLGALWMVTCMIRITEFLRARGEKVNFLLLRIMIFEYVRKYRRITTQETGRPGHLHTQMVTSAVGTLAFALAAVLRMRGLL